MIEKGEKFVLQSIYLYFRWSIMSVESQTAGKNDEVSNEADLANDVGHVGPTVDKYLIVKDDFSGSVSSASDNVQSDVFSIKTSLDHDGTTPSKVRKKSGKTQTFVIPHHVTETKHYNEINFTFMNFRIEL